jgi:mannosyltransferase OCH1-like enzyme
VIPRIFHQIWLGPHPLPDELAAYVESWRTHHPGWQHRLWTEETLPPGLQRAVYERLRSPAERSDVLRLEVLARHGGIYVDTDFECLRPLDPLLEAVDLFAGEYKNGRVNNAIIGAAAGHPTIERGLAEVRPRERFGASNMPDKEATGPLFVDRLLRGGGATIFERKLFYPTWPERGEAYAFHHMARSWKDEAGYRKSILLASERLAQADARLAPGRLRAALRLHRYTAATTALRARGKARRILEPRYDVAFARLPHGRHRPVRVPRLLHHVWVTPGPLPTDVAARLASWRLCHPDWEQRLWREDDIAGDLVRPEAADLLRSPAEREELLRLEVVARHGGLAADLRLACRRRFDGAVTDLDAFAASAAPGVPDPCLVGAVPDSPAIRRALEAAEPYEWHGYDEGTTGARALAETLADGLTLLPPELVAGTGHARLRALAVGRGPRHSLAERRRLQEELRALEERLRARQTTRG